MKFVSDSVARILIVVAATVLVEFLCAQGYIPQSVLPRPSNIAAAMVELLRSGEFNDAILVTLTSVVVGAGIAIVAGIVLGVVIHAAPRVRNALEPLFASYYAVPSFLFYPVFIVIFGVGRMSIIAIAVVMGLVAVIVGTLAGLDSMPRVFKRTAAILRVGRIKTALTIQIPAAAPYLFSGIKLAVAYSFIGVLASEFILSGSGLGYQIADAYNQFDNRTMYGLILFIVIVVIVVNSLLQAWDRRFQLRRRR